MDNGLFFAGELDGGSTIAGNPFYYDPSKGNLLLTVAVTGNEADCSLADGSLSCGSQGLMWRAEKEQEHHGHGTLLISFRTVSRFQVQTMWD